jgi:hypothetical protein
MKRIFFALIISLPTVTYGQNGPKGSYRLMAIQNKASNTLDSTTQEHGLVINFGTDTTFTFTKSVNHCSGTYYFNKEDINLKPRICTFICCDTKLADEFYKFLEVIDKFRVDKDELILENFTWALYLNRIQ